MYRFHHKLFCRGINLLSDIFFLLGVGRGDVCMQSRNLPPDPGTKAFIFIISDTSSSMIMLVCRKMCRKVHFMMDLL